MKKLLILCLFLVNIFSFTAVAETQQPSSTILQKVECGHAVPLTDPRFCASFKAIAYCHCHDEHGMPPKACSDMNYVYQILIATYGSLVNACSARGQHDVPPQECIDNWNFYTSHC